MKTFLLCVAWLFGSSALASPAQDIFDEVAYYLVINYGGTSTADVRGLPDKYQPKLEAACIGMANTCPADKAYPVIQAMLTELNDEHTGFYPNLGNVGRSLLAGNSSSFGVGLRLTVLENRVIVQGVLAGSGAAQAGVQRGDEIVGVNFRPVNKKTFGDVWNDINADGGYVNIARLGVTKRVRLQPSRLEPELPSLQMRPDGIGVLKIPDFFGRGIGTVANKVHELLAKTNAKSIILELRDNPGGIVADCTGAAGAFFDNANNRFVARSAAGGVEFFNRDNQVWQRRTNFEGSLIKIAMPARFTGRVAVLQNASSASCAEFLASNLQSAARAKIFGEPSAGVANTSTSFFFLSNNSLLLITLNTRVSSNNQPFASRVTPDEIVEDDLLQLNQTGLDAVLERAVAYLNAP